MSSDPNLDNVGERPCDETPVVTPRSSTSDTRKTKSKKKKKAEKSKNLKLSPDNAESSDDARHKLCAVCEQPVQLAYRCRWDSSRQWRFVCRPCWPSISGSDYLENLNKSLSLRRGEESDQAPGTKSSTARGRARSAAQRRNWEQYSLKTRRELLGIRLQ